MPSFGSTTATLFIAVGLAGVWGQAVSHATPKSGPAFPIAALAWAQANCDSALALRPGTPRIQAEDLMRAAAAYDADREAHGLAHVCRQATAVAAPVAAGHENSPAAHILAVFASLR
jgi:hypothetical protein